MPSFQEAYSSWRKILDSTKYTLYLREYMLASWLDLQLVFCIKHKGPSTNGENLSPLLCMNWKHFNKSQVVGKLLTGCQRVTLPTWFEHLDNSFSYKEVIQFKAICPPVETTYPPVETLVKPQNRSILTTDSSQTETLMWALSIRIDMSRSPFYQLPA